MHNSFSCKKSRKICCLLKLNKPRIKVNTWKELLLLMLTSFSVKFLPRDSVSFFFLGSWNIPCIFCWSLWTEACEIFSVKLGLIFKLKECSDQPQNYWLRLSLWYMHGFHVCQLTPRFVCKCIIIPNEIQTSGGSNST